MLLFLGSPKPFRRTGTFPQLRPEAASPSYPNELEMGSQESSLEEALPEGQGAVGLCDPCAKADPAWGGLGPKRSRSCLNIWCPWSLSKGREGAGGRARNGLWLRAPCAQPSSSALSTRLLHVTPRVLVQFSRSLLCALDLSPPELRAGSWCVSMSYFLHLFNSPRCSQDVKGSSS